MTVMRPVWSLFPKTYRDFSAPQLAELVRTVGLDTTNVVVRKGYEVDEDTIRTTLPTFTKAMNVEGLKIVRASTTYPADALCGDDSPLPIMVDAGIKEFRMGWFPKTELNVERTIQQAKADMDRVAEACQKYRIKAIYQVHHNTLVMSATGAYNLVRGLPSQWIGVELDPGNQSYQGYEAWHHSVDLLGDYLSWVAVKDTITWRDKSKADAPDKGWQRTFAPINEGVTNWHRLAEALKAANFDGTLVFMPFYDEQDEPSRTRKLKDEVSYLKKIITDRDQLEK